MRPLHSSGWWTWCWMGWLGDFAWSTLMMWWPLFRLSRTIYWGYDKYLTGFVRRTLNWKHRSADFSKGRLNSWGISCQPNEFPQILRVNTVRNWPEFRNLYEDRAFVALASYYRRYIKGFADVARPLHELTQKDRPFVWTKKQQRAFKELKKLPNECICDIIACWRTKIFAGQRCFGSSARSSFTTGARGKVKGHSICFQSFIFSWNGVLCGQEGTSRCCYEPLPQLYWLIIRLIVRRGTI